VAENESKITRRLLLHKQNKFFKAQAQINKEALEKSKEAEAERVKVYEEKLKDLTFHITAALKKSEKSNEEAVKKVVKITTELKME